MAEELADRIWERLKHECAAHKPADYDKVKRLVMVSQEDVRKAVIAATEAGGMVLVPCDIAARLEAMAKEWFRCLSVDGSVTVKPSDDGWIRDNAEWCRKMAKLLAARPQGATHDR